MAGERDLGYPSPPKVELGSVNSFNPDEAPVTGAEDEALLNEKRRQQSRQMLRQVRGQIAGSTGTLRSSHPTSTPPIHPVNPMPTPPQPVSNPVQPPTTKVVAKTPDVDKDDFFAELFTENVLKPLQSIPPPPVAQKVTVKPPVVSSSQKPSQPSVATTPPPKIAGVTPPVSSQERLTASPVQPKVYYSPAPTYAPMLREKPASVRFQPERSAKQRRVEPYEKRRWLDIVGLVLEGAVIVAIIIIIGYLQFGWFQPSLTPISSSTSSSSNPAALWNSGAVINVDAGNTFLNLPAAPTTTVASHTTLVPTTTSPVATAEPASPTPTITISSATVANVPTVAATFTPVIVKATVAATPTVNPVLGDVSQSPPTRLVIPKLGVDTPVKDVTVKLGSWQVADFAAGHNLGTANPGEVGNLVLAGHRDIRGSVFLHLPELQKGDEFTVYSKAGAFHYIVTEIFEVAPTDITVMDPTPDASATLITCTPLGTSNRRLIVRARLVN